MSLKKNILFKSIPAASWTSLNPLLKEGEPGIESDTGKMKVGDGSTRWTDLDYQAADKADAADIPTALNELSEDSTHMTVTDTEKSTWNDADKTETAINNSSPIDKSGVTDTSKFPLLNGEESNTLVHLTYSDLKSLLRDYFDTLYTPL